MLFGLLLGGAAQSALAAETGRLEARVMIRGSITAVPGARVKVSSGAATIELTTDEKGHFVAELPAGTAEVIVRASGHELLHARATISTGATTKAEYLLRALPAYRRPFETTVRARSTNEGQHVTLRGEELRTLPGGLGDPFRMIGLLAGVATPLPLLPVFVVRGASPGMNGFFLDGMRVPQLFHLLVGGGVIHARFVDQIDFYPGAYDASFGRYAGGIIDARTRPAGKDGYHGELELRLYDLSAAVELPLPHEVRLTISGHYGYPGPLVHAIDNRVDVSYWDYQLRLDYRGLTVQALGSFDELTISDPSLILGGSTGTGSSGRPIENSFRQTFHRLQLRYVGHRGRLQVETAAVGGIDELTIFQGNGVRKLSLNLRTILSLQWPHLRLRAGLDTELSRFTAENFSTDPVRTHPDDLGDLDGSRDGVVGSAFAVATVEPWRGISATASARVDVYHAGSVTLLGIDPRLQIRAQLTDWLTVHGGFGYYQQPPSFPVALPGIDTFALNLGLQHAIQGAVGEELKLPASFSLNITGYYQSYKNINDVVIDFSPIACTSPPPESLSGYAAQITRQVDGQSYGMEFMLRRHSGRVTGWVAYTLSRAERAFSCGLRPADYDQTHVLNTVLQVRLPWNLLAGARLFVSTGRPVTQLQLPDGSGTLRNNVRLPTTVQLDVRVDREWLFRRFALIVFLEVVNATFSEAVFGLAYPKEGAITRYDQPMVNGFRWIIPSIGIRGRF